MVEMSLIEALKKLEELNDCADILVATNAGEPQLIENAIEDILRNADDPEEVFDLHVTQETIRVIDEDGYIKSGEPLYTVVNEDDENHRGMSEKEWKGLFHPSNVLHEFKIFGYEAIERTATPVSSKSNTNRVYVPKDWTRVMVVRLE